MFNHYVKSSSLLCPPPAPPPTPTPLQVLKYTAGHINYGGRVTDDWDRRCIMNILNDFYCPPALSDEYQFSESGIYHQLQPDADHKVGVMGIFIACRHDSRSL